MAHFRHTPVADLELEARWELEAIQLGVERFQQQEKEKEEGDRASGRMVMRETVEPVAKLIEERLVEKDGPGFPPPWRVLLSGASSEVLSVIAVGVALRTKNLPGTDRRGQPLPTFNGRIAHAVRDQRDFDRWSSEQRKAAREQDKEERAAEPADVALQRFERMNQGKRNRSRAWARFVERMEIARTADWSPNDEHSVGTFLAGALVEAAPKWFAVEEVGAKKSAHAPMCLVLTDYAVGRMADSEDRASVARPMLLPMLVPPNDWRYSAGQEHMEHSVAD